MKTLIIAISLVIIPLVAEAAKVSDAAVAAQNPCVPEIGEVTDSTGICTGTTSTVMPLPGEEIKLFQSVIGQSPFGTIEKRASNKNISMIRERKKVVIYFFWGRGCPHCDKEEIFLFELQHKNPSLEIKSYEVWYNKANAVMLHSLLQARGMVASGVPITFIDRSVITGFSRQSQATIAELIQNCLSATCADPTDILLTQSGHTGSPSAPSGSTTMTSNDGETEFVDIPLAGMLDARATSLFLLTIIIAGMDSFNPCAFFVLLTLLGLLVHAQSRNKMLLVGGVFVFFSGFIYYLFMIAWLNLFLVIGRVALITTIAGSVSILIAAVNIKDFFIFKKGVSLTIPIIAKPKLFDRMRKLLRSTSLVPILVGTTVLAVVANSYELLCTAGFPMVYTRILTLHHLTPKIYYLYLTLYNIVYIVPLFLIVVVLTFTLGNKKLTEWRGRFMKLISGTMMLGLGSVLLVNPALLNSFVISFLLLFGAFGVSIILASVTRRFGY